MSRRRASILLTLSCIQKGDDPNVSERSKGADFIPLQVLKWLEECFRSHLNDSDPTMRNGFGYDFVEVTNEQLKDLALIA